LVWGSMVRLESSVAPRILTYRMLPVKGYRAQSRGGRESGKWQITRHRHRQCTQCIANCINCEAIL